jgi:hypothetical protein
MEKNYLASTKRIAQKNLKGKIRFFSPELRLPNESSELQKTKKKVFSRRDSNFEKSLQFSPIRYVNSPEAKISMKKNKKTAQVSVFKTSRPNVSPSKFRKNLSHKLFTSGSPTSVLKFLSPKQLSLQKPKPFCRSKLEDSKLWKKILNSSNGIEPNSSYFVNYSVFIGRGNNSSLVKKTILSRNWWNLTEDKEKANFVWTQWKDKAYLASLPSLLNKPQEKDPFFSIPGKDLPTGMKLITDSKSFCPLKPEKIFSESLKMHNKLEFNNQISNKKVFFLQ